MAEDLSSSNPDRRSKPRVRCSYPAIVRLRSNARKEKVQAQAVLTDISAVGMYLRMRPEARVGDSMFIMVRFSTAALTIDNQTTPNTPRIAANGVVTRVDVLPDGSHGVAVSMKGHRFI